MLGARTPPLHPFRGMTPHTTAACAAGVVTVIPPRGTASAVDTAGTEGYGCTPAVGWLRIQWKRALLE